MQEQLRPIEGHFHTPHLSIGCQGLVPVVVAAFRVGDADGDVHGQWFSPSLAIRYDS
jgi:hypothetical protein